MIAMEIIGVGIATIDLIHDVSEYPKEDSKIRTISSHKSRGGNCTNALVNCAQLGRTCHWIGTSTDPTIDTDAKFIYQNLEQYGINCSWTTRFTTGSLPTSFILRSQATSSRTIIHSRDLPELSFISFQEKIRIFKASQRYWFHFEGRNVKEVAQMLHYVQNTYEQSTISLEIEALRNSWEIMQSLATFAHVIYLSKEYIRENLGCTTAEAFYLQYIKTLQDPEVRVDSWLQKAVLVICPWGDRGVYYIDLVHSFEELQHIPIPLIDDTDKQLVDTIGAGDTFVGASIAALSRLSALQENTVDRKRKMLKFACNVATWKCYQLGFHMTSNQKQEYQQQLELL